MKKILIVKTSALGDVIQSFPVLEELRRRFPTAQIDWVIERGCAPLLASHPSVSAIHQIDTKKWKQFPLSRKTWLELATFIRTLRKQRYDLLFDIQGNTKSGLITLIAKSTRKIGFALGSAKEWVNTLSTRERVSFDPTHNVRRQYLEQVYTILGEREGEEIKRRLKLSREEEERLDQEKKKIGTRPLFMICFGSKWANKRLSQETLMRWLQSVGDHLKCSFIFVYAGSEEKEQAEQLTCCGKESWTIGEMSLPLWQALMCEVDGVVAMDSAALHLCGTTATPSFSLFGPTLATVFRPPGEEHGGVQGKCPYGRTFNRQCSVLRSCPTGACLRTLDPNALTEAFVSWWSE